MQESLVVQLRPEGLSRVKKRITIRLLSLLVFLIPFILIIHQTNVPWVVFAMIFLWLPVMGAIVYRRAMKTTVQRWQSYTLTLDEHTIKKDEQDFTAVVIQRGQITAIEELKDGGLMVKTADKALFIYIPPEVERRNEVVNSLAATTPITVQQQEPFTVRYRSLLLVVWMGIIIAFFGSSTLVPVTIFGSCILIILFYMHYQSRRYQAVLPKQAKTGLLIFFVPLIVMVRILFIVVGGR